MLLIIISTTSSNGGETMNKVEKFVEVRTLKGEANVAKDRLMLIENKLREIGANREANSLSALIEKLEIWQNK